MKGSIKRDTSSTAKQIFSKGYYVEKFSEGHEGGQQVLVVGVVHDHEDVRAPAFVDAVLLSLKKDNAS